MHKPPADEPNSFSDQPKRLQPLGLPKPIHNKVVVLRLVHSEADSAVAPTPQRLQARPAKPDRPVPATGGRAAAAFDAVMAGTGAAKPKSPLRVARTHPGYATPGNAAGLPAPAGEKTLREVAAENRRAAAIDPEDARWTVAVATAMAVEGGRAGIISAERRANVAKLATSVGLRPFDAALIMAVVQDATRAGEAPLSVGVQQRLQLIGTTGITSETTTREHTTDRARLVVAVVWAVLLGLIGMWALVRWVLLHR